MKHCIAVAAVLSLSLLTGCCAVKNCDSKCDKAEKGGCQKKFSKADFAGRWLIYVRKDGKLEGLPVKPQPEIELKACGKMIFHYAKDDKPATAEGVWTLDGNNITLGSAADSSVQRKIVVINDKELEMIIGDGDALPAGTRLLLMKK